MQQILPMYVYASLFAFITIKSQRSGVYSQNQTYSKVLSAEHINAYKAYCLFIQRKFLHIQLIRFSKRIVLVKFISFKIARLHVCGHCQFHWQVISISVNVWHVCWRHGFEQIIDLHALCLVTATCWQRNMQCTLHLLNIQLCFNCRSCLQ